MTQLLSHPPRPSTAKGQREPRQTEGAHQPAREGTEIHLREGFRGWCCNATKAQLFCCPSSELGCAFHFPASELSQQSSVPRLGAPGSATGLDEKSSRAGPGEPG